MKSIDPSRTAAYYAEHAVEYFQRTANLDLSAVYAPFEKALKPASHILDLGCGSGRDARYFAGRGHCVLAADPCRELLALATRHTSDELSDRIEYRFGSVPCLGFEDARFDAIWACGSLLHLARENVLPALRECRRILRRNSLLGLSMKAGTGEVVEDGRVMVLWKKEDLIAIIAEAGFEILDTMHKNSLHERNVLWINIVARSV